MLNVVLALLPFFILLSRKSRKGKEYSNCTYFQIYTVRRGYLHRLLDFVAGTVNQVAWMPSIFKGDSLIPLLAYRAGLLFQPHRHGPSSIPHNNLSLYPREQHSITQGRRCHAHQFFIQLDKGAGCADL